SESNITQPRPTLEVSAESGSQGPAHGPDGATQGPGSAGQEAISMPRSWRDIEAAGRRLETCRFGSPDAPLRVVLLHEGLGSVAAWRDFPARLAQSIGEPVLAYSRAGYGQSDPLPGPRGPGFMHHEAQVVLPALLRALAIDQP